MPFVSSLLVSGNNEILSALQSFVVTTLSWTLIATGVSGTAENFVARSSGVSGDRQIMLKFGVSIAQSPALSVFACVSFASATSVTSNPTTELNLQTNSGGAITIFMQGDKDHIFVGTNRTRDASQATWLYGGITDQFRKTVSATPNLVVLANGTGPDPGTNNTRIVEMPAGTFNAVAQLATFNKPNIIDRSDPNLDDGLVYLWPMVVGNTATDRVIGTLKDGFAIGDAIAQNQVLTASGQDYIAFASMDAAGNVKAGFAVRNT